MLQPYDDTFVDYKLYRRFCYEKFQEVEDELIKATRISEKVVSSPSVDTPPASVVTLFPSIGECKSSNQRKVFTPLMTKEKPDKLDEIIKILEQAPDFRELLTTVVHRLSIIRLCEAAIG